MYWLVVAVLFIIAFSLGVTMVLIDQKNSK